jgi:hypothetical protein
MIFTLNILKFWKTYNNFILGEEMDKNMMEKIKLLKRELFMDGFDTIENFVGYKLNEDEDDDVIERRVDIAIDSMSEDELNIWFVKYNIV